MLHSLLMQESPYVGTADAARRLGVDRSTVVRWVEAKKLEPAVVVPGYRGAFLFAEATIAALESVSRA